MKRPSRRFTIVGRIGGAVIAVTSGVAWMGWEDWRRGLTVNHAAIARDAEDPELKSPLLPSTVDEVAGRIAEWASRQPRWTLVTRDQQPDQVRLHLTRRTRIFRFTDEIDVRLDAEGSATRLTAQSRSRIGKGDLGQNARNLKELLNAIGNSR